MANLNAEQKKTRGRLLDHLYDKHLDQGSSMESAEIKIIDMMNDPEQRRIINALAASGT